METSHPPFVRSRLSVLMFLTFFIWGSWGFALGGYADFLGFTGAQAGRLVGVAAIGAMIAPLFVGLIADRFFAAQRVLSVLHVLSGVSLVGAGVVGSQGNYQMLWGLMMLHGLFFMPTLALANAVSFKHIPDASKFPRIAVFGTIGWIVAVLIADVFLGGMGTSKFLFQAGAASFVLSLYCWTLPNTPPKGAEGGTDAFGLNALKLLKNPSFLIFIVCVFLVSIPACGYFFTLLGAMLKQRDYPSPLALTSINQFAEIVFMFTMPWFVMKLGMKRVLMIGMAAWALRYLCFTSPNFGFAFIGLILHGVCYSFLYVGAYMYVDKRAPDDLKASAQSLLTFLLIGIGWYVGCEGAGFMKDKYPANVEGMPGVVVKSEEVKEFARLPRWDDPNASESALRFLDLPGVVKGWLKEESEEAKPDLPKLFDADENGKIALTEIEQFKDDTFVVDGVTYKKADLITTVKTIVKEEKELARDQWMAAQVNQWKPIWFYPSIAVFAILAFFFIGFREEKDEEEVPADAG
ncbi:MAG: MFS transporter [Planctomycetes bacterium]|nr:MFS transporter [Planctomycetota bacterium]